MLQLTLMGSEAGFDITKALSVSKLSKRHDEILVEATEPLYIAFALIPGDASTKGVHRQVIHDLRNNKLACIHDFSTWKFRGKHLRILDSSSSC